MKRAPASPLLPTSSRASVALMLAAGLAAAGMLTACSPLPPVATATGTSVHEQRQSLLREIDPLPRAQQLGHLYGALHAKRPERRAAAAKVLGMNFLLSTAELTPLALALRDAEPAVRFHAAQALLAQRPELAMDRVTTTTRGHSGGAEHMAPPSHKGGPASPPRLSVGKSPLDEIDLNHLSRREQERLRALDDLRTLVRSQLRPLAPLPGGPVTGDNILRLLDQSTLGPGMPMPPTLGTPSLHP